MRPLAAALALLAASGCSDGYRRAAPSPPAPASTWAPRQPGYVAPYGTIGDADLGPAIPPDTDPPPYADVDGDGLPDAVTTTETPDRSSEAWRWAIQVDASRLGPLLLWSDCCTNEGQGVRVVGDVDGDGRDELAGSDGSTATAAGWFLVTLRGERLARVEGPELWTGIADGETTWSCVGREVVVATAVFQGTAGTRTYYRLDGTRLVRTRQVRDRWRRGGTPPPEYTRAIAC